MTEQDEQKFYEIWTAAWQTVGKTPSPDGMRLAFAALARFELQDVARAIQEHVTDPERGRYAVTPADIISRLEVSHEEHAARLWPQVMRAVSRYGRYRSVRFDDDAVTEAIRDIGGWIALCDSTERDLPRLQREFISAYANHKRAGTKAQGVLSGEFGDGGPICLVRLESPTSGTSTSRACVRAR